MVEQNESTGSAEIEPSKVPQEPAEENAVPRAKPRRRRPRYRKVKRDLTKPQDSASAETSATVVQETSPTSLADDGPPIDVLSPEVDGGGDKEAAQVPEKGKSRRRRRRSRKGKRPETAESTEIEPLAEKSQKDRTKRILINARYPDEKRVAIVEGDILVDFYVEVASREHLKGNIYKGIISSLMPSLQAAFIDFGQKKHGFLQYREVMPELLQAGKSDVQEGKQSGQNGLVKGQEILVQVEKDEHGTKGASLTTYISIPGRYIVMMPGQKRVGISRKIECREDRDRLKETFNSLKLPKDTGFILRTACSDSLEKELGLDLKYLTKLWDRIKADDGKTKAPALIYKEQDIAMRTVRDYLTPAVAEVLIDDAATYAATKAFLRKIMPWRKINVTHYKEKKPLYGLY